MELRQLEAFVAVAHELHFGRAAAKLDMAQPTVSELVHRLERELGTPLFHRTTRRVALTEAGTALLAHATTVLAAVADASAAVRSIGSGEGGTVRVGYTPPAAPVLAPHLCSTFATVAPLVRVEQTQLWLPGLLKALEADIIDVAITSGVREAPEGVVIEAFASEPLLVGLRPGHRLAAQAAVDLRALAGERLGMTEPSLFPAWTTSQREALEAAGIAPPIVSLTRTDLNAVNWLAQPDVDWVLLTGSLTAGHVDTVIRPVVPALDVTFVLLWMPSRAPSPAVARFVRHAVESRPPLGWHARRGHFRHPSPTLG